MQSDDGGRTGVSSGDELGLDASVLFRLDRVVFSPEEVALVRAEQGLERERSSVVEAVVHLYYERRRLQLERDVAGAWSVARAVRVAEIEALLDAFTGGVYRRMMAAARRAAGRGTDITR